MKNSSQAEGDRRTVGATRDVGENDCRQPSNWVCLVFLTVCVVTGPCVGQR